MRVDQPHGFIYIWRRRTDKRLYIGCHWGTDGDGYVCSSKEMRRAHDAAPAEFRRKIVQRVFTNRDELEEAEHQWLQLIPDEELGRKFFNKTKHRFRHWTANDNQAEIRAAHSRSMKIVNARLNGPKNKARSEQIRLVAEQAVEFFSKNSETFTIGQVAEKFSVTYSILRKILSERGWTESGSRFKKGTNASSYAELLASEHIRSLSCFEASKLLGISSNSVAVYRRELGIKKEKLCLVV